MIRYESSLGKALSVLYPGTFHYSHVIVITLSEYKWQLWRFERVPSKFFSVEENRNEYIKWLENSLFITKPCDWYEISLKILWKFHGIGLARNYRELSNRLDEYYKEKYLFQEINFSETAEKSQKFLYRMVRSIFPRDSEILENYPGSFLSMGKDITLDIYIPSLNLAFEYQGEQHYMETRLFGCPMNQKYRDYKKMMLCNIFQTTLIQVPYNWDHDLKWYIF
jgi:hypothetical protein